MPVTLSEGGPVLKHDGRWKSISFVSCAGWHELDGGRISAPVVA
jgi:hypothetical protein